MTCCLPWRITCSGDNCCRYRSLPAHRTRFTNEPKRFSMLRSIFAKLFGHQPAGSRAKRASFSPRLEALENRLVPTLSVHSTATAVFVDGDYWGNDNLTVRAFGDGSYAVEDGTGVSISVAAGK